MPAFNGARAALTRNNSAQNTAGSPTTVSNVADLTEFFILNKASMFTDAAGTTNVAASGDAIALVKAQNGRSETLTQATAAKQPVFRQTPISVPTINAYDAAYFNGTSSYFTPSFKAARRTCIAVYRADNVGRNFYFLVSAPSSGGVGDLWATYIAATSPARDCMRLTGGTSGTNPGSFTSPVTGALMCDGFRKTATAQDLWRSGKLCTSSVAAITGTETPPAGTYAAIGARISTSGALDSYYQGHLCALISYSSKVPDAEMPGLMQWLMNQFGLEAAPVDKYLGMFFGGTGVVNNENGVAVSMQTIVSRDLKNFKYRPCSGNTFTSGGPNGAATQASGPDCRDFGIIYEPVSDRLIIPKTGSLTAKAFDIHYMVDQFNILPLKTVDCSALAYPGTNGGSTWAPEFVRNPDGTIWLDSAGLPAIVFAVGNGSTNMIMKPAVIQPVDNTWATGGAWGTPFLLPGFTEVTTFIDCSCTVTADGVFHLFGSGQSTTSYIYLYNATTDVAGKFPSTAATWTKQANPVTGNPANMEGPQVIQMSANVWRMTMDNQGAGYFWADATSINGPYGVPVKCSCDFFPEHGNLVPMPASWGAPPF